MSIIDYAACPHHNRVRQGAAGLLLLAFSTVAVGDITNWQTGETIAGTEGIELEPQLDLSEWNAADHNLRYADFSNVDLRHSDFAESWLDHARFDQSNLVGVNFTKAKLTDVILTDANLFGTNFSQAIVTGANFENATLGQGRITLPQGTVFRSTVGFTKEQFYSTADYRSGTLSEIGFEDMDLSEWDFSGQNIEGGFRFVTMSDANFANVTFRGQFYRVEEMSGVSLVNADLTNAGFRDTSLLNLDFTGATIAGARFLFSDLAEHQLQSTKSYQEKNLAGINFGEWADLTGWDLNGQDLTDANFFRANLYGADLSNTDLSRAVLTGAILAGVDFSQAIVVGTRFDGFFGSVPPDFIPDTFLTQAQLYSTASYQAGDLRGILLNRLKLDGWNFRGQNLAGSDFWGSTLIHAEFEHANLTNARFGTTTLTNANFSGADLRGASGFVPDDYTIVRNVIWPDATIQGLELLTGESLTVRALSGVSNEIHVASQFNVAPDAVLEFVAGTGAGEIISPTLIVSPNVSRAIAGKLRLTGPVPAIGTTFDLFDWSGPLAGEEGHFADVELPGGTLWDLNSLYTSGEITLTGFTAPEAIQVLLRSSSWSEEFKGALGTDGYALAPSQNQMEPLPWTIDEIQIAFDQNVEVLQSDLLVISVSREQPVDVLSVEYDASSNIATWAIDPVAADELMVVLTDGVNSTFSGMSLNSFAFLLNVLAGDADQDGTNSLNDLQSLATNWGQPVTAETIFTDFDGSGEMSLNDLQILASNWGRSLASAKATTVVPEPSYLLTFGVLLLLIFARSTSAVERTSPCL